MINQIYLYPTHIMSLFNKSILDVLEDTNYVYNLYNYIQNTINGTEEYDGLEKLKLDTIENYLLYLSKQKELSSQEISILTKYKTYYLREFKTNPNKLISSKIYKYYQSFFNSSECNFIKNDLELFSQKALKIANSLLSNEKVSIRDINFLMSFLTNKLGTKVEGLKNLQERIISLILNSKIEGLYSKLFLISYYAHNYCKENNYDEISVYISKYNLIDQDKLDVNGRIYGNSRMISLNTNLCNGILSNGKKVDLDVNAKLLQAIFHELTHYKQITDASKKNIISINTIEYIKSRLFNANLSTSDLKEYFLNYKHRGIEREANIYGWKKAYEVLNTYAPDKLIDIAKLELNALTTIKEQSVGYQINPMTNKKQNLPEYNVKFLKLIIEYNPSMLETYPQLKFFFKEDGKLKDLKEFITMITEIELKSEKYEGYQIDINVFDEFITVLTMENIDTFPLDINEDYLVTWFNIIIKLYNKECNNLLDIDIIKKDTSKNDIKYFSNYHYQIIKKYKKYLDKNSELLRKIKLSNNRLNYDKEEISKMYNDAQRLFKSLNNETNKKGINHGMR